MNPEQARAELVRRELARRELSRRGGANESMAQKSGEFGAISKTPTALEKIGTNLTSRETQPLGVTGGLGVLLSAAGIPEENILPMVGQGIGGMASGFTGAGMVGATGGAVAGQGVKQLVKQARGQKADYGEMGKEALVTGAIEGATRGTGNIVFRRQIAKEAMEALGKQIGEIKQAMSNNPNLKAPVNEVYHKMTEAFNALPEPMQTGSVANKLKQWMKYMSNKADLSAKDLIHMESDLGKAASYGEYSKGAFIPATELPNPAANKIAKEGRTGVSNIVDDLATSTGNKNFKSLSTKMSKILKNPDAYDVTKSTGGFGQRLVAAGAVGGMTQNPLVGAGTYLAMQALQSPEARNMGYKIAKSKVGSAVGKIGKLTLSELMRKKNA